MSEHGSIWKIEYTKDGKREYSIHRHNAVADYRGLYPDAVSIELPAELKPCPFCGGDASTGENYESHPEQRWHIACRKCGGAVLDQFSPEIAIYAWNRRTNIE